MRSDVRSRSIGLRAPGGADRYAGGGGARPYARPAWPEEHPRPRGTSDRHRGWTVAEMCERDHPRCGGSE
jgi:hypothetical protein